jgi:hypothetical protein
MTMKKSVLLLVLASSLVAAQENKGTSFFAGTAQGLSFLQREALSNTDNKTFGTVPGHAHTYTFGINIDAKNGKGFSEIGLGYRSQANGFKGAIDPDSDTGRSSKTSRDRYNLLALEYRYSRYIPTIKEWNTFFSIGVQTGYILNRKVVLNLEDAKTRIRTPGRNISNNFVLNTSPTLVFSYGVELDRWPFSKNTCDCKRLRQRLSLDVTYDWFALNIMSSPANAYSSIALNYRILF